MSADGGRSRCRGCPACRCHRERPVARQQAKAKKKGGRGVSGNPAKRNQQPRPAAVDAGSPFGVPQNMDPAELQKALGDFQLPPELTKRLGK